MSSTEIDSLQNQQGKIINMINSDAQWIAMGKQNLTSLFGWWTLTKPTLHQAKAEEKIHGVESSGCNWLHGIPFEP